ncbi:hypothetical protein A2Y26_00135 [candidate division CPR2 bacterium GWD2_39_7]|nr:MAG: hypothetical protein A2Y27_02210 [candidate division CPR2 bacterium GWD1_39_7]OGB70371.1 MAG: hypothetical protein A2Y26_00135 [candidate division CPR2 bacterium GWD2_39_7]
MRYAHVAMTFFACVCVGMVFNQMLAITNPHSTVFLVFIVEGEVVEKRILACMMSVAILALASITILAWYFKRNECQV